MNDIEEKREFRNELLEQIERMGFGTSVEGVCLDRNRRH